jgi:butyryl-CoA dehydrogenase
MEGFGIELTEEQRLVRETARAFAADKVAPLSRKVDHEHYFPKELIPELGSLGFLGVFVDEEFGGSGLDYVCYSSIVEELARQCASTSVILSAHNSLGIWPILAYGNPEQKAQYLPNMASGKSIGCFALSEPSTGSDAAAQTCRCVKEGSQWRIHGVKNWITNGPVADVCILFAMYEPEKRHKGICAFIVDLKTIPGISIGKLEEKLGICGSPTASITFENALIPETALLGAVGDGFKIAMSTLDGGRIGIAAQAVGIARAALEDSLAYTRDRSAFGKPIIEHQSVQNHLADMSVGTDAARLLTLHAAHLKDQTRPYGREAAQAKLFASENAVSCALKGIQLHGGYGYVKDYNVERYLRDAKITEIYEGTSEIQRLVISSHLAKA